MAASTDPDPRSIDPRAPGGFYIDQHNRVLPHAAFDGQMPDEMYIGSGEGVASLLEEARGLRRDWFGNGLRVLSTDTSFA